MDNIQYLDEQVTWRTELSNAKYYAGTNARKRTKVYQVGDEHFWWIHTIKLKAKKIGQCIILGYTGTTHMRQSYIQD